MNKVQLRNGAFRMPSQGTITGRISSITNSFAQAIIPRINPTPEEIDEALKILQIDPLNLECAYCGDPSSEWDHLRPLIKSRRPTGFISEIGNLVPSCGKCNQSKGNSEWETWMTGPARWSPATRGVADLDNRIARLKRFAVWKKPTSADVGTLVGSQIWDSYWSKWKLLVEAMKSAQAEADQIKRMVAERNR
jgi:5-methylcytosine-specific restriction endonuclease McrA